MRTLLGSSRHPFLKRQRMRARARVLMQTWSDDNQGHAGGIYVFIYNLQYLTGIRTARGRKLPILN